MKLYNRTKVPDDLLKPLLTAAARAVGARYAHVPIKITQGRKLGSSGEASCCIWVKLWVLNGKPAQDRWDRRITCDGGYITVVLPDYRLQWFREHLEQCTLDLFNTMLHEFAHIRDMQTKEYHDLCVRNLCKTKTRQLPWKRRPTEVSAINKTDDALARGTAERSLEHLTKLACWFAAQNVQEHRAQGLPEALQLT